MRCSGWPIGVSRPAARPSAAAEAKERRDCLGFLVAPLLPHGFWHAFSDFARSGAPPPPLLMLAGWVWPCLCSPEPRQHEQTRSCLQPRLSQRRNPTHPQHTAELTAHSSQPLTLSLCFDNRAECRAPITARTLGGCLTDWSPHLL
ncbi:hypothetical protein L1887_55285 [Cichorium endivia]|nr:hypothetical protein L1887_55285 [Cichorium endivia]